MFLYGVLFSGPASSTYIVRRADKSKTASTFTLLVSAWGIGYMFTPTMAGFPLVPQFLSDVYHIDVLHIGILESFTYLGGSTLSLIMGRIGDKHGETTSIAIAMILVAIALTIFISVENFASLVFASFLRGASFPMSAFIGATVGPRAPIASRARWISVVQTIT
jgi:MFS family permease